MSEQERTPDQADTRLQPTAQPWITKTAQSCSACGQGSSDDDPTNTRYGDSPLAFCDECQRNGMAAHTYSIHIHQEAIKQNGWR